LTDDSNVVETDDNVDIDLDTFEKDFYQKDETPAAEDELKDEVENEEDSLADENEDEAEPKAEEEPKPEEKPAKRNRAQERINQLLERERLATERALRAEQRMAELEAAKTETKPEKQAPSLREQLPADAPNPDAKDENGEPLYALGEFDPKYIQDITKYTFHKELSAAQDKAREEQERQAQQAYQQRLQEQRVELQTNWQAKLDAAETENPEIREELEDFVGAFAGLEPQYGEYLATTLMNLDNGPEVMLYLSQNIGEAQEIVAHGPYAATIALAKLDARFEKAAAKEEPKRNKKMSNAPGVPPTSTRGQRVNTEVPADTENLSAFEREFYKR
jgi:hypothetical protein